jgi:hypothetical protein
MLPPVTAQATQRSGKTTIDKLVRNRISLQASPTALANDRFLRLQVPQEISKAPNVLNLRLWPIDVNAEVPGAGDGDHARLEHPFPGGVGAYDLR